jgi:hypothetical protein
MMNKSVCKIGVLIGLMAIAQAAVAISGSGNGGDEYALDFIKIATLDIYPCLQQYGDQFNPKVDADGFLKAVDPHSVASVAHVYESCVVVVRNRGQKNQHLESVPQGARDREVEACHDPQSNMIYLSRALYPVRVEQSLAKRGVIAHEIFRKLGLEGDDYQTSSQFEMICGSAKHEAISTTAATSDPTLAPPAPPKLTDFARNNDHSIMRPSWKKAVQYCAGLGSRLPTIREYALLSQSMGAMGIRETAFPNVDINSPVIANERSLNAREGFKEIYRKNSSGALVIDFYFNKLGYRKSFGELDETWLWSSSLNPSISTSKDQQFYEFVGDDGHVDESVGTAWTDLIGDDSGCAIRCIANP